MQDRHHLVPLWRPTLWHEVRILDLRRQPGTLLSPLTHRHTLSTHREHQDYIIDPFNSSEWAIRAFYSSEPEAEGKRGLGIAKCGCTKCDRCGYQAVRQKGRSHFRMISHEKFVGDIWWIMMLIWEIKIYKNSRLFIGSDFLNSSSLYESICVWCYFIRTEDINHFYNYDNCLNSANSI